MASQEVNHSIQNQEQNDHLEHLCQRCRALDLKASQFYLPPEAAAENRNPKNITDPIELDDRSWDSLKKEVHCSLCRLIVFAVETSSREWQAGEPPRRCKIQSARMNLNDKHNNLIGAQWDLRNLDIKAEYSWTESDLIRLLPVKCNSLHEPFVGRLIKGDNIDPYQISDWLHVCESSHNDHCKSQRTGDFTKVKTELLVIDVLRGCLTRLPNNARYIALSYVWGKVDQPQTVLANFQEFCTPGGLSKITENIPRTISDAIKLVDLLGERYLWVDALCIIQDDSISKQSMIERMHVIYQNALLTVFAATGSDANAGLPGVTSPRGTVQQVATMPDGLKFIFPMHYLGIKSSIWASRGWTYQEYFFSKRRLIFFEGQVVYECNTMRWREDVSQEHLIKGITYYQIDIGGDRMGWKPPRHWDRHWYTQCLETYIDRSLTKDDDILNAFTGITEEAARHGVETFYGLTTQHFGMDLLWVPCRWASRRFGFPSWSWTGWKGPVIMHKIYPDFSKPEAWTQSMSWISYYAFDGAEGNFHVIAPFAPPSPAERVRTDKENYSKAWDGRINSGRVLTSLLARLAMGPSDISPANRMQPLDNAASSGYDRTTLCFRSLTAVLSISALKPDGEQALPPRCEDPFLPSARSLFLYTNDGIHIGTAWVHEEHIHQKIMSGTANGKNCLRVEVVVIAGPLRADWRTRNECPPERDIMWDLIEAGVNARDIIARNFTKARYHTEIGKNFLEMIKEKCPQTYDKVPIEQLELDDDFWTVLEQRASQFQFHGHSKESFEAFKISLMKTNSYMHVDVSVRYFRVLLIGNLGGEMVSDTGKATEVFGKGEINQDLLGLIAGLAFRSVFLK